MSPRRLIPAYLMGLCGLVLVAAIVIIMVYTPIARGSQNLSLIAAPGTTTTPPETLCAQFFLVETRVPTGKRARQEPAYQNCVSARQSPLPPTDVSERFGGGTPGPTVLAVLTRRPAGAGTIVEDPGPRFGSSLMVTNEWYAQVGGKRIVVWAATERSDGAVELAHPWESMLIVEVTTLDGSQHYATEQGTYEIPVRSDDVRITDAVGQLLTVKAQNGATFYFDVPTRRFTSSSITPTPIATPMSTPTVPPYP